MIPIKCVTIEVNGEKLEFSNVLQAQKTLLLRAKKYPKENSIPHIINIIYDDGQYISLFMECKHPSEKDADLWIVQHLHDFLAFYAGFWRPNELDEDQYQKYMSENHLGKEWFRNFIKRYETGYQIDMKA